MKTTVGTIGTFGLAVTVVTLAYGSPKPSPSPIQKAEPCGIVRLFNESVAKPPNNPAWSNPNIDGMRARLPWYVAQPDEANFDWSDLDEMLDLGEQHGKFIGLSVAAGIYTPSWVYANGAMRYRISDGSGSMPVPWDTAFLSQWLRFIRQLGARYDSDPALGYVVMSGMGQNIETYVAQTARDHVRLNKLGGPTAWKQAAQRIIKAYADAFPTTPFFITAAKPFHTAEGLSALQEVLDWGVTTYPGRFGIMDASLAAHSNTGYYPNLAIYTYSNTQPAGFQQLCSEAHDRARLRGTLAQALRAGVRLGAKFVEVYQADADRPANQRTLATQGTALRDNLPP